MPAPWATTTDLNAYLTGSPYPAPSGDTATRLLARAFEVIDDHTTGTWAEVAGVPTWTDPSDDTITVDVTDTLVAAVCAQVEQWLEVGEDNDIAGYARDTTVSFGVSTTSLPDLLAPRAARVLRKALLLVQPAAIGVELR